MSILNPESNFPSLNRKDLMSLSNINHLDAKFHKFKTIDTLRDWSVNICNFDIQKSSPKKCAIYTNKEDYINKIDDIERSNPKLLHYQTNKPEYNLNIKDISGTSPKFYKFVTNRTPFNPLEPKYQLPAYAETPEENVKFLRDTLYIRDIEGSYPKKYFNWETRKNLNIFKNTKNSIVKEKIKDYNYIDYSDINKKRFYSKRLVNPLNPVYDVKFDNQNIGLIEKSKPNSLYNLIYRNPNNLKTDDISGAQAGTVNKINKFSSQNNLLINDIEGTASGSLKKYIVTNRITNPISPDYILPGHLTNKNNQFDPFCESSCKVKERPKSEYIITKIKKKNIFDENKEGKKKENNYIDNIESKKDEVLGFNNQFYYEEQ